MPMRRDAFMPLYTVNLSTSWVLALTWMRNSILAGLDGGVAFTITPGGPPADKAVSVYT